MNAFNQRVTRIKGLSDRRRLPRLGTIRLGLKVKNSKGVEYPRETEYFVCPSEVQAIYGEKPVSLDIMVPINEIDAVFPTSYKFYGSSKGLKCQGDGEKAIRPNEAGEMAEIDCPCELLEQGKCKQMASLMVMLPKVSVGGIYQIRTSSYNSIVDVNSGLDYVSALLGRFAMVPLTLRRVKTETHHDEKKQNHYTLQITFDGNIDTLNQLRADTQRILEHPRYQLPAPKEDNPADDPIDIIEDEEKQGPPPEDPPPPPPPATGKTATFAVTMQDFKKLHGEPRYYQILKSFGFKHCNEVKDRKQQITIFKAMTENKAMIICANSEKPIDLKECDLCEIKEGCPTLQG